MNKERLLKIVDHLKNGKLAHEVFDFSCINTNGGLMGQWVEDINNPCGTHGCAFGEFPTIFPEDWEFKRIGSLIDDLVIVPCLRGTNPRYTTDAFEQMVPYLDLTMMEMNFLFIPQTLMEPMTIPGYGNTSYLPSRATKEQVADNILAFIAYKESIS